MPDPIGKITEESTWEGRPLNVTWHGSSLNPPRELITQASGACFTDDGTIVLVTSDDQAWMLPGGHPEPGERIDETFAREVAEEACAVVTHLAYLGAQEVHDPQNPMGLTTYYQARFWARVTLGEFHSRHETIARKCVSPLAVRAILNWRTTRVLDAIWQTAIDLEAQFRAGALITSMQAVGHAPSRTKR